MGYQYEVSYNAYYYVESDVKLTDDEVLEQAIQQHEDLPDGDWTIELEVETVD